MKKIKYLDLFAGCGGLSDGFLQTEMYEEVAAVEWLKPQVNTLKNRLQKKWGVSNVDRSVLHFDIQREEELFHGWENDKEFGDGVGLDKLVEEAEGIDIVIGGPPCQAYSIAGRVRDKNGMANDYRNYLFEHYLNVVSRYQPKLFVFENVPGMLSAKPGSGDVHVTDLVRSGFDSIGYEIIDNLKEAVVNASDFGVPQNRKRVIIIGVRKDIPSIDNKHQEILQNFYNIYLNNVKVEKAQTVEDAINDLQKFKPVQSDPKKKIAYEMIENSGLELNWHTPRYHSERDKGIFKLLAKDIEDGTNLYTNSKEISKLYEEKIGSKSPIHRYHVLRRNQPSTTIIAHLYKDGNRFIHYDSDQSRTLTPREAARLQSFDDDFEFLGARGAVYQMIGNAVPPLLAKKIALAVRSVIDELN
ncbi:DNA cytosine methyltransferase [Kurthia gibsonii]|uniref:DNA cytosine methyltransferase n=1 Tax=Kurthia gibsonii TaxID=33946 RepID=UPI000EAB9E1D|nr:DNA cytosine methyltransferase [Kurthia gibsonii]RXH53189.1 DNA cytosine methyltransferase [Kurthia gibsonii]